MNIEDSDGADFSPNFQISKKTPNWHFDILKDEL